MIVFSISDKGGTGRSVTSCNLAYRLSAEARDVVYLDFDFGSPTAGALFEIRSVERGVKGNTGLHSYLLRESTVLTRLDVRAESDREELRSPQPGFGKLVLLPGDESGAEFTKFDDDTVKHCADLLLTLDREFDVTFVDLSAGRSVAVQIALMATALEAFRQRTVRWLVFHRWTRQHILAANGLVHGDFGLVKVGAAYGHNPATLLESIRYIRTAVPATNAFTGGEFAQSAWLKKQHDELKDLAAKKNLGNTWLLGETPIEPVLQWREQIILDVDVHAKIANEATTRAFSTIARRLMAPDWGEM